MANQPFLTLNNGVTMPQVGLGTWNVSIFVSVVLLFWYEYFSLAN